MKLRKLLASLGVALLGVAGALVVTEAPASAHETNGCYTGQFCTWIDEGYGGSMYYYTYGAGACVNIGWPFDNAISSVINLRYNSVVLYDGYYCSGSGANDDTIAGTSGPWTHHVPSLNNFSNDYFNDRASSIRFN